VLKAPERPKDSEELVTAAKECQEGSAEQCEKAFGLYHEDHHSEKFKASSKGCELGSGVPCVEAGLAYVRGRGVQQDQGTAAQFFLKACNANNVSACARIGVMARDMGNVDAAAEILGQACQTLPRACRDLAMIYQNDSYDRKDEEKARALYKKACDGGDNIGCTGLQQMGQ